MEGIWESPGSSHGEAVTLQQNNVGCCVSGLFTANCHITSLS